MGHHSEITTQQIDWDQYCWVGLTFARGSNGRSCVKDKFHIGILKGEAILVGLLTVKLQNVINWAI